MQKLIKYLFLLFIIPNFSLADIEKKSNNAKAKEELKAEFILNHIQQDYITCYAFYKIATEVIGSSGAKNNIVKGLKKSADISLKLIYETGEITGMNIEDMREKVKLEIKLQESVIVNDNNSFSKLSKKHGFLCKNLIENKKQRIDYWEKKSIHKFK